MNKVLIIHLKRFGDLVSAGQTIGALRAVNPHCEFHLLCFSEFKSVAKLIPGLKQIHSISRDQVLTLKRGQLYNSGFAVNALHESLQSLLEHNWDKVINLTNSKASAWLTSWVASHSKRTHVIGMSAQDNHVMTASNDWAIIFNEILTKTSVNAPFNFQDVWTRMVGTIFSGPTPLLTNSKNDQTVKAHFEQIRADGQPVVGLQLTASCADKGFNKETSTELLEELYDLGLNPVVLSAPTDEDREFIQDVQNTLTFKPIIVEADFTALSSVIRNLNFLITPDTVTKHFADAHSIPCLEVSLGSSPYLKQATLNEKSMVLVARDRQRAIATNDIIKSFIALKNNRTCEKLSNDCTLYQVCTVAGVHLYRPIAGHIDHTLELERLASASILLKGRDPNSSEFQKAVIPLMLQTLAQSNDFIVWSGSVKNECADLMKDVLHAIRSLLAVRENPRRSRDFVESLERLFAQAEHVLSYNVPVHFFKARVESLPPQSFEENTRSIEQLLFNLKAECQDVLQFYNQLDKAWTELKFSQRSTIRVTTTTL